jgi:acyl carrier protein phosphodiesterase
MESAMAIAAEHTKVKTLELEQKVRATPLVGDLEFYSVFINMTLTLLETWLEGERVESCLQSSAVAAIMFMTVVDTMADTAPQLRQTRSYILADTMVILHTLYPHYGKDDELSEEMDRALRAAFICLRSHAHTQDVSGEQLETSVQVRDYLKELTGHAAALEIQDVVDAEIDRVAATL